VFEYKNPTPIGDSTWSIFDSVNIYQDDVITSSQKDKNKKKGHSTNIQFVILPNFQEY
jgi:hypothetical protein